MLEIGYAPWLRIEGETSLAFEAFCHFRDMGPRRSLRQLANERESWASLQRWSAQHGWVDRAAAWDDHLHRLRDDACEAGIVVVDEQRDAVEQFLLTQLMRGAVSLSKSQDIYEAQVAERIKEAERENKPVDLSDLYPPIDVDVMKTLSEIIDKVARKVATQHDVSVLVGQIPGAALARAVLTDDIASEHALAFAHRAAELRANEPVT